MRKILGAVLVPALLAGAALPCQAQKEAGWQDLWFWGGQAGVSIYKTPTSGGAQVALLVGGHWLITGKRAALHLGYDQILYPDGPVAETSSIGGVGVQFDNGRYIQADLLAMPIKGPLQLLAGAGVLIHQISDPVPVGTFASPDLLAAAQAFVDANATKAFGNLLAGFQLRFGSRAAIFGTYRFIPSARDFLISSEQHVFTGGLRIALSGRSEDVNAQN